MKNSNLFILMAVVFALFSCGTANRSAYNNGSQFRNSIYYTPQRVEANEYAQQAEYLEELQERTVTATENAAARQSYNAATNTKEIYVGDNNYVNIDATPGVTYKIIDDQESYEARLRKFDSPFYSINIDINDFNSWYDYRYGWYGTWHRPWYMSYYWWHTPSWYMRWNWHYNWGIYDPFYDPWWGPDYWYGYYPGYYPGYWPGYWPSHRPGIHPPHKPGYYPGHGPGAKPTPGRDVYYGKRNSTPSYNAHKGNNNIVNNNPASRPNTGSVTRKPQQTNVSGNNRPQNNNGAPQGNSANRQYRRVTPDKAASNKGNVSTSTDKKTAPANKSNSFYSRDNNRNSNTTSSYNRSTGSQNRSSYSSGNSNYSNRSSGNSSNGGGSSYRRR